jgi:chemotaxis protein methyltransferase CheR
LYGLILLQLNLHDEAEKAFRQTIFLNYDFMEAHYQLGQVLLYKGQQKQAIKAISNALYLAEQNDGRRPVHNVITLTYASFAEAIKNELSVLNKGVKAND